MSQRKILVLSRTLTSGGAERVAANLASELNKVYPTWLVVFDGSIKTYTTTANLIDLQQPLIKGKLGKLKWYLRYICSIRKIKRDLGVTCTISFLNEPDLVNVFTKGNDKVVVSVRNKRSALNKNRLVDMKDRWVFKKADEIIALSQGVRQNLKDYYGVDGDKIRVIYNACDTQRIAELKDDEICIPGAVELFDKYKEKIVITAGRLTAQKGQWHLVRAFKKVRESIPDVKLLILGQGELEKYLSALITKNNLTDSVYMMGYHSNPYQFLSRANLFVFSSLFEGFGNILLEAMACGLPIISTNCEYGPIELLNPNDIKQNVSEMAFAEYGILVPVCDGNQYDADVALTSEEEILADAIIETLSDNEMLMRYKTASMERIKDFSNQIILSQWVDVCKEVD